VENDVAIKERRSKKIEAAIKFRKDRESSTAGIGTKSKLSPIKKINGSPAPLRVSQEQIDHLPYLYKILVETFIEHNTGDFVLIDQEGKLNEKLIVPEIGLISRSTFNELPEKFQKVALKLADRGEIIIGQEDEKKKRNGEKQGEVVKVPVNQKREKPIKGSEIALPVMTLTQEEIDHFSDPLVRMVARKWIAEGRAILVDQEGKPISKKSKETKESPVLELSWNEIRAFDLPVRLAALEMIKEGRAILVDE